jgi:hypothetical protein
MSDERRHWICLRCPAGYFCVWGDLPVMEPADFGRRGHRHEWVIRTGNDFPHIGFSWPSSSGKSA